MSDRNKLLVARDQQARTAGTQLKEAIMTEEAGTIYCIWLEGTGTGTGTGTKRTLGFFICEMADEEHEDALDWIATFNTAQTALVVQIEEVGDALTWFWDTFAADPDGCCPCAKLDDMFDHYADADLGCGEITVAELKELLGDYVISSKMVLN